MKTRILAAVLLKMIPLLHLISVELGATVFTNFCTSDQELNQQIEDLNKNQEALITYESKTRTEDVRYY